MPREQTAVHLEKEQRQPLLLLEDQVEERINFPAEVKEQW